MRAANETVEDAVYVPSDGVTRPGRPRRFSSEEERQLILDNAMAVMRRNSSADANVTEILDEAGLSTRAFYRHFASKDDLLRAMHRRESERAAQRLVARVDAAESGVARLEAWIDEQMSFVYDRRRAVRVALMSSEVAQRASDASERTNTRALMVAPLVALLEQGRRDGAFPRAEPDVHSRSIHALVSGLLHAGVAGTWLWPSRTQAVADVMRFCLPALGADVDDETTKTKVANI